MSHEIIIEKSGDKYVLEFLKNGQTTGRQVWSIQKAAALLAQAGVKEARAKKLWQYWNWPGGKKRVEVKNPRDWFWSN